LQQLTPELDGLIGGRKGIANSPITIEGVYLLVSGDTVDVLYAQNDYRSSAYQTRFAITTVQQPLSPSLPGLVPSRPQVLLRTTSGGPVGPGEPGIPHDARGIPIATDGSQLTGRRLQSIYDFTNGWAAGVRQLWRSALSVAP